VAYVQLDAPFHAHYLDSTAREQLHTDRVDPDQLCVQSIVADNTCMITSGKYFHSTRHRVDNHDNGH
jgi:hypothetical protein